MSLKQLPIDDSYKYKEILVPNLKSEARGEKRGLEEQHDQVLDGLVTLVRLHPLSQVLNCAQTIFSI